MEALRVVQTAPAFDEDLGFVQRIEKFPVQQLIPQFCSVVPSLQQTSVIPNPLPVLISIVRRCPKSISAGAGRGPEAVPLGLRRTRRTRQAPRQSSKSATQRDCFLEDWLSWTLFSQLPNPLHAADAGATKEDDDRDAHDGQQKPHSDKHAERRHDHTSWLFSPCQSVQ